AIVALGRRPDGFEDRTRLRVAPRAEQTLGTSELQLVAIRAGCDRRERQRIELGARRGGIVAERKLEEDARERVGRLLPVAGGAPARRGRPAASRHAKRSAAPSRTRRRLRVSRPRRIRRAHSLVPKARSTTATDRSQRAGDWSA